MLLEISIAVGYIQSQLYTKLPRRRIDNFGEELTKLLTKKFQNHWHPEDSKKEKFYRCLNTNQADLSQILIDAADLSSLQWSEIKKYLPKGLIIEINPGNVSCQYSPVEGLAGNSPNNSPPTLNNPMWTNSSSGCSSASSEASSQGQMVVETLYSGDISIDKKITSQPTNLDIIDALKTEINLSDEGVSFPVSNADGWSFQPSQPPSTTMRGSVKSLFTRQQSLQNSQSVPFVQHQHSKSLNGHPTQSSTSRVLALAANQNHNLLVKNDPIKVPATNSNQAFTAAMFAQTKFGSTKLKNHTSKKNKRFVSPNDLQRTPQVNNISENQPTYSSNNSNQKQEGSISKQEMLREALQYQQQLLNNAELHNNPTSTTMVSNILHDDRQNNGVIWPTPIGAQRKQQKNEHVFNSDLYQSFDKHLTESLLDNLYDDEIENLSMSNQSQGYSLPSATGPTSMNPWSSFSTPTTQLSSKWSTNSGIGLHYPMNDFNSPSFLGSNMGTINPGNLNNGSNIRYNPSNNLNIDDLPPLQQLNLDSVIS